MKRLVTLTLFTLLASFYCLATIRTVSNDPQNPAQFTSIQAALDASIAGDTVYVNGSAIDYGESPNVVKRLVIVGAGYNPAGPPNLATRINGRFTLFSGASGTVISGFRLGGFLANSGNVNNIQVLRNYIGYLISGAAVNFNGSNWAFSHNLIINCSIQINNSAGVLIQNNIFSNGGLSSSNQPSVIVDHNLFLGSISPLNTNIRNATVSNNIFALTQGPTIDATTQSNSFVNNINVLTNVAATAPTNSFAGGPNSETGNLYGVDPQFVSVANFTSYNVFFDYRLKSTSPGKNAGNDATDIGIYGGGFPFPTGGASGGGFDTSAQPPVPQVTNVNIQNSSVAPGTQLRVTIQATVNN